MEIARKSSIILKDIYNAMDNRPLTIKEMLDYYNELKETRNKAGKEDDNGGVAADKYNGNAYQ